MTLSEELQFGVQPVTQTFFLPTLVINVHMVLSEHNEEVHRIRRSTMLLFKNIAKTKLTMLNVSKLSFLIKSSSVYGQARKATSNIS